MGEGTRGNRQSTKAPWRGDGRFRSHAKALRPSTAHCAPHVRLRMSAPLLAQGRGLGRPPVFDPNGVAYVQDSNPPKKAHDQDDTGFQVCSRGQSAHFAEKRSVCGSVRLDDPGACAPVSWPEGSCSARPGRLARVTERFRTASGALSGESARILTGSTQFAARPVRSTGDPGSALVVASLVRFMDHFSGPAHAERVAYRARLSGLTRQAPGKCRFAWQAGYGVFSVSPSNVEAVRK